MRKVCLLVGFCLGLLVCLTLAVRVACLPATPAPAQDGPAPSVGSAPENKADRLVRRWTGHVHHFLRRFKPRRQDTDLNDQRQQED